MTEAIIAIIAAIISYFAAKEGGASDGEAALIGAAAGAGTYYVATQTEWGKSSVKWLEESWDSLVSDGAVTVTGPDGQPMRLPAGSELLKDASGNVVLDSNGNPLVKVKTPDGNGGWFETITTVTGDVLKSWGGVGTAAVVGAGSIPDVLDTIKSNPLPWLVGLGLVLLLVLR